MEKQSKINYLKVLVLKLQGAKQMPVKIVYQGYEITVYQGPAIDKLSFFGSNVAGVSWFTNSWNEITKLCI